MAQYFSDKEVAGLDSRLVILLDQMRAHAGIPIVITAGLRTPEDNKACQGVSDSAHLKGLAADLHCPDSQTRLKLIGAAISVGFVRIGDETAHVHVDISEDLPQNVMWVGISH